MATTYQSNQPILTKSDVGMQINSTLFLAPAGRILFSLIFLLSGISHFSQVTINYAMSQQIPAAAFLVPLTGIMVMVGGLSVALGYRARWGALLIILFLVPVTLVMHNFWDFTDPSLRQMQFVNFMKNVSLLGGAILIAFFGSGPMSLDRANQR